MGSCARNDQPPNISAGRQRRVSVKARGQSVRNAALDVHTIQPWSRTIGIACEVHKGAPVQHDRITHLPMVRRDPVGNSTSRTNAPDVQFVWQRALNEVEERRVGRRGGKDSRRPSNAKEFVTTAWFCVDPVSTIVNRYMMSEKTCLDSRSLSSIQNQRFRYFTDTNASGGLNFPLWMRI